MCERWCVNNSGVNVDVVLSLKFGRMSDGKKQQHEKPVLLEPSFFSLAWGARFLFVFFCGGGGREPVAIVCKKQQEQSTHWKQLVLHG